MKIEIISFFLQAMNGQYLCNRQITVSYAYKKDTKGERHGTPAGEVCCSCSYCVSLSMSFPSMVGLLLSLMRSLKLIEVESK